MGATLIFSVVLVATIFHPVLAQKIKIKVLNEENENIRFVYLMDDKGTILGVTSLDGTATFLETEIQGNVSLIHPLYNEVI
ncbi:MAG: hypothetical protein ACK5MD_09200 [Flavobacteriales bacterium]